MPACRAAGGRGRQAAAAEGRAEASRELAPRSRLGLSGLFEAKLRRPPPGPSVWQMGGGGIPSSGPAPQLPSLEQAQTGPASSQGTDPGRGRGAASSRPRAWAPAGTEQAGRRQPPGGQQRCSGVDLCLAARAAPGGEGGKRRERMRRELDPAALNTAPGPL